MTSVASERAAATILAANATRQDNGRCATCKKWTPWPEPDDAIGGCAAGIKEQSAVAITRAEFGCTYHERKPEAGP